VRGGMKLPTGGGGRGGTTAGHSLVSPAGRHSIVSCNVKVDPGARYM
jgi:hypothetical protein